ncbi:MAG: four-carbon acid sugar kinase family protein, partial [Lachnospiraceae bacterium]|nr:four-carbon acid sugar kinase family protein [Lachnospiraceae bacterium]
MNHNQENKNAAVRLLILADDLTGALDTGVMLA